MIRYDRYLEQARDVDLDILGSVQRDGSILLLLGPNGPGFWDAFKASPEYRDGQSDPMDRWSLRVIGDLARAWNGLALFPFGKDNALPFESWAIESGRAWKSPVGMLVHDNQGLLVSYRGAVLIHTEFVVLDKPKPSPCATCGTPCVEACPVGALTDAGYNLAACRNYLTQKPNCYHKGCDVRRVCPISQTYARNHEQSRFHMKAFLS